MESTSSQSDVAIDDALDWPKLLQDAISSGELLNLADGVAYDVLSERLKTHWETLPVLPASLLREALLSSEGARDPNGLQLRGVRIEGDLDLDFAELTRPLRLYSVRIDGDLQLTSYVGPDVHLYNVTLRSLHMRSAQVQNAFTAIDCTFDGIVDAGNACFGDFSVEGSTVTSGAGYEVAVQLSLGSVRGDLNVKSATLHGQLDAVGLDVRGSIFLSETEIRVLSSPNDASDASQVKPTALCLDSAEVGGILDCSGLEAWGQVLARGTKIGGQLKLNGARLKDGRRRQYSLDLDGTEVLHDAMLDGIEAKSISAGGASVRELSLRSAHLKRDGVASVWADGLKVEHNVFLDGAELSGALSLRGAVVGGNITTQAFPRSGTTSAKIGAIDISDVRLNGSFTVATDLQGDMLANRSSIIGRFDLGLIGLVSSGPIGERAEEKIGLVAHASTFGHLKVIADNRNSTVDFSDSVIEILEIAEEHSPGDHQSVLPNLGSTESWKIGSLRGLSDFETVRKWLRACPTPSHTQPWFAMADVLERSGNASDARKLRFEATDNLFKQRKNPLSRSFWRFITKVSIGHGYYSQRALGWLLVFYLLTAGVAAANAPAFIPSDRSAAITTSSESGPGETIHESATMTTALSDPAPLAYPSFIPGLYAVDVVLSPLGTGQSDAWRVSADPLLNVGLVGLKLMSWAMLGLFVTGVSGLVNKR